MQTVLKEKLWAYIVHNNPDLLLELQESNTVASYLEEKASGILPIADQMFTLGNSAYVVEEFCLMEMTKELRPSKYNYIRSVLEDEFPSDYERLNQSGILVYEVLNMLRACQPVFEDFSFTHETQESNKLRHAVIVSIHDSLIK